MLTLLTMLIALPSSSEPYRPYPIILIHGINSNAGTWGFEIDSVDTANGIDYPVVVDTLIGEHTSLALWNLLRPYFFLVGQDSLRDIRTFLATLNFDNFGGSIDPGEYDSPNHAESTYISNGDTITVQFPLEGKGSGAELRYFIYKVLRTYYGADWQDNSDFRVVLKTLLPEVKV